MKLLFLFLFNLYSSIGIAQFIDNFSDSNFIINPVWLGNTSDFIINNSLQLQTNTTTAGSSFLTSLHALNSMSSKEWRFWIKMAFSPSSNNFSKVYLSSSNSDLSINPDGYYLLFGETGSTDAVRLFKQINGIATEICAGPIGQISTSFAIGVKVVRDDIGNWILSIDSSGGENYTNETTGFDSSTNFGPYFGLICTYTASNASKFYFDNFYAGNQILDTLAPNLFSTSVIYENQIDLLFDEVLESESAQNTLNYSLTPSITISSVTLDNLNPKIVHLSLGSPLINGQSYLIGCQNISDKSGNLSSNQSKEFVFMISEIPALGDVIITEFMADPSPSIGLPEVEFVEIYNRSASYFNISGWKIGDSSTEGTILEKWLIPGQYVVLCSTGSVVDYPNGIGVTSFPSLNNAGDNIVLKTNSGKIIDQISYTDNWYHDKTKKEGGHSIERINLLVPCSGELNWKASTSISGGTPFFQNSVFDNSPDETAPSIQSISIKNQNSIEIQFNEGMDSLSLQNSNLYIHPFLTESNRFIDSYYPSKLQLQFSETFTGSLEYTILIENIEDCSQNEVDLTGKFVLAELPVPGDLVINEILFEPKTGSYDFIELHNISSKVVDIHDLSFANISKGEISNQKLISSHYNLKPTDFVVVSEDTVSIQQNYSTSVSGKFIENDLPNYNSDSSSVILLLDSIVLDKVSYSVDWQFKLLDDTKGKSLERINPNGKSNSSNNWHTASETEGFATPGKVNSQKYISDEVGSFELESKTISPDNDGFEDLLRIQYKMKTQSMVGTLSIYDENGRLIRTVFNNNLLGSEGSLTWDGITDSNTKALLGIYICVLEAYDINGGAIFSKNKAFTVVGKL